MTKWHVKKSRESTDWVAPWIAISPYTKVRYFSTWRDALGYANFEARQEATDAQ